MEVIHRKPRDAGIQTGFFYRYSNDASSARLSEGGLTQWHPTFLTLAETRDECSARYRNFCRQNRPEAKPKPRDTSGWGNQRLPSFPGGVAFGCQVTAPRFPPDMAAVVQRRPSSEALDLRLFTEYITKSPPGSRH